MAGTESPSRYYFPAQHNSVGNNFPCTFMGLEPGTTKAQVRRCLVRDMPKERHTDLDFIVDQLD